MQNATARRTSRKVGPADLITALRLPLAAAFVVVDDWRWRMVFVVLAGLSDYLDGIVARRMGASRFGVVLDPIADKTFMVAAFLTLVGGQLTELISIWELLAVLLRDFAAIAAFVGTVIVRRPLTLPARWSGKCVTVGQFAVLVALVLHWPAVRPLAWATAAVSLWSVVDYFREGRRVDRERRQA